MVEQRVGPYALETTVPVAVINPALGGDVRTDWIDWLVSTSRDWGAFPLHGDVNESADRGCFQRISFRLYSSLQQRYLILAAFQLLR